MSPKTSNLDSVLKEGKVGPLYLLVGPETYLRDRAADAIADAALSDTLLREFNLTSCSLLGGDARDPVAVAEQMPMMASRRVVKIKDFGKLSDADEEILIQYLNRPAETSVVIFIAADLDKRKRLTKTLLDKCQVIEFEPLKNFEAKNWVKKRLKELKMLADERVVDEVVELVGTNVQTLYSELDKLAAAGINEGRITTEMVHDLIGRSRELSNFDLGDQLLLGDRQRAMLTLHRLLEDDVAPVMLVGLIAGNYHRLMLAKDSLARGARAEASKFIFGYNRDAVMRRLERVDSQTIAGAIRRIASTDLAIKSSIGGSGVKGAQLQLEMLVCELAG